MFEFEFFSNFIAYFFWALFWPFLTLLAIFDTSSRVTSPKLFWVGKPVTNTFDEGAHTLIRIFPTRICMISSRAHPLGMWDATFKLVFFNIPAQRRHPDQK